MPVQISSVPLKTGKQRAARPVEQAGKDYDLTCKNKNASGLPFWGPWGAPDEYSYGVSDSKFYLPTGSMHDGGWVQNVSWKGRCAREGLIRGNKEISAVDGTDAERIDHMREFIRHQGASQDSARSQIQKYGEPVLKKEGELTRGGFNRTALGGLFAPKNKTSKVVGMAHRAKTSHSWVKGIDGPMASSLVSLRNKGYGFDTPPVKHSAASSQDNFYACSPRYRDMESLTTPMDLRAESPLFPNEPQTGRTGSVMSGATGYTAGTSHMSGSSRRSGMTRMSGMTAMSGRTGSSKSGHAPMPARSPGVSAVYGFQQPLTRRGTKAFTSWNGYFADR